MLASDKVDQRSPLIKAAPELVLREQASGHLDLVSLNASIHGRMSSMNRSDDRQDVSKRPAQSSEATASESPRLSLYSDGSNRPPTSDNVSYVRLGCHFYQGLTTPTESLFRCPGSGALGNYSALRSPSVTFAYSRSTYLELARRLAAIRRMEQADHRPDLARSLAAIVP